MTTLTENGAISLETTNDPRVDLFFKTVRFEKGKRTNKRTNKRNKFSYNLETESSSESENKEKINKQEINYSHVFNLIDFSLEKFPLDTIKILYNWRDCRGGKGDRSGFFESLIYIYNKSNYANWIIQNLEVLPEYGRFLDLIELYHLTTDKILEKKILQIFVDKIIKDTQNLNTNQSISLAAKWIPRENGKWDRCSGKRFYIEFCKEFRNKKYVSKEDLKFVRKNVLGPLKNHLKLVETLIVEKKYSEINYSTVPSIAMKNYRKLFMKYDSERFRNYLSSVEKGEIKINANQLYPHDIVKSYKFNLNNLDTVLEEQWKVIKNKVDDTKSFHNSICVVDVSGSMAGTPMEVAIALGLLSLNETNNNSVITFHSEPTVVKIVGNTLLKQFKTISEISWGYNTNIERVFDIIFGMCIGGKIIEKIFIFSDMQFDEATNKSKNKTHYTLLKEKFNSIGLTLPKIIFWNLRADTKDFPVCCDENGVILLSGYSPSLLLTIIDGNDINPLSVVLSIINSERYNLIKEPVSN